MSGEGHNAKPGGFEDYDDMCERPFRKILFEERAFSGRTVGSQSHDICGCSADDRKGDGLLIRCTGGTAAGRDGGGRAGWEGCCERCWGQEGQFDERC